ncbi:hypothetical protein [Comamonas sp. JC664]|uniref:hypothetical protein n=1 Tax=Comamonas sp. JC664 TaxID=2801917 RepID=UPI00174CC147|nr:hypothetical protein [Comamonas sp. JC664]MBL0694233.1 hypothetical protein [Comamonas sp. JC664]GHG76488.1 hypothetical protein GCM10012319_25630 [Comamonas sp. KCTC 72670]
MKKSILLATALSFFFVACSESSTGPYAPLRATEGVLQLPLVSTTSNGEQYRLVGATFVITGMEDRIITDTSADTLVVPLLAGTYSIRLEGDWHLERLGPTSATVVAATLISPNPMAFSITARATQDVRFLFKVPAEGTATVGITVDEGGWITGTLDFTYLFPGPSGSEFSPLLDQQVPFTISFETATFSRDYWDGLTVETEGVTVQFGGPYSEVLHARVAPTLTGGTARFQLARTDSNEIFFTNLNMWNDDNPLYGLSVYGGTPFWGRLDHERIPVRQPFTFAESYFSLHSSSSGFIEGTAEGNGVP